MSNMRWFKGYKFLMIGVVLLVSGCSTVAASKESETVEVTLKEYSIGNGEIHLPASEKPVNVTITNKGTSPHNFVIKELGVDSGILSSGQSVTLEISAKNTAVIQANCTLPGHTEAGMVSKVIIDK